MEEKYENIKRAPMLAINERAEEISFPSFPEEVRLYMDTYRPRDPSFSEKHWHHSMQFNVVLEGELEAYVNDRAYILQPGDGIFFNADVLHCLNARENSVCSCYSFQVPISAICSEKDIVLYEKYITPVVRSEKFSHIYFDSGLEWKRRVLGLLKEAFQLAVHKEFAGELKIKAILLNIWCILLENMGREYLTEDTERKISRSTERIKEMMEFVQRCCSEKITLKDIADSASVSISECSRVFRKNLNTTPMEYLNQVRIYKACIGLKNSGEKAATIGHMAGFSDYSYFYRVFKKYMSCTPNEYREAHRMDQTNLTK